MNPHATTHDGLEQRSRVTVDESWLKVLAKFGLGGGIAAFLVWQLAGDIKTNTATTAAALSQHITDTKDAGIERDRILQGLLNVTIQQCVNAAATKDKRDACFSAIDRVVWARNPK